MSLTRMMSGGYWFSHDLLEWTFVPTKILPQEDYAPDVRVIDDAIWFTASRADKPCPVYRSREPGTDAWRRLGVAAGRQVAPRSGFWKGEPHDASIPA